MSQNPSPKTKKDGSVGNNLKEYDHDYVQDRDKCHSDSYRYNSDYVWMFDSIEIIEPDALPEQSLGWGGEGDQEKNMGGVQGRPIQ